MLAGAYTLQVASQNNAPVKTGYLKSSAESSETDNGAEMAFTADYSYYQEFGTSKMQGKFYVSRAVDEHSNDIVESIGNQMQKDIGEAL